MWQWRDLVARSRWMRHGPRVVGSVVAVGPVRPVLGGRHVPLRSVLHAVSFWLKNVIVFE